MFRRCLLGLDHLLEWFISYLSSQYYLSEAIASKRSRAYLCPWPRSRWQMWFSCFELVFWLPYYWMGSASWVCLYLSWQLDAVAFCPACFGKATRLCRCFCHSDLVHACSIRIHCEAQRPASHHQVHHRHYHSLLRSIKILLTLHLGLIGLFVRRILSPSQVCFAP